MTDNTHQTDTQPTILNAPVAPTRAVVYARVSRDDSMNEGRNLQGQIDMGRQYAEEKGYNVIGEISEDDKGASGVEIDLPGLNQIRDMAQNSQFDALIVREIDRLSRSLAKQLIIEEELKRNGVTIEYVIGEYADTPEGRLSKHIRATVAEYEREKITERMVRGRRSKVKSGSVIVSSRPPYGYKVRKEGNSYYLEIFEEEAKIVRLMYEWYANEGLSVYGVKKRLTEMQIPRPADKDARIYRKSQTPCKWNHYTILKILRSETYMGIWHYGKNGKGGKAGEKTIRHDREKWIPVEVPDIVSLELWEKVQEKLATGKKRSKRNLKHNYLMRSRIRCGVCNYAASGTTHKDKKKSYSYYRCGSRSVNGDKVAEVPCIMPNTRVDKIDGIAWDFLTRIISDPQYLEAKIEAYQSESDDNNKPILARISVIDDLLTENQDKRTRWLEMRANGLISDDEVKERVANIQKTINELEKQKAEQEAKLSKGKFTPEEIKGVSELAALLKNELPHMADFEHKRWLVEAMDANAVLYVEDDKIMVEISCRLGAENFEVQQLQRMGIVIAPSSFYLVEQFVIGGINV